MMNHTETEELRELLQLILPKAQMQSPELTEDEMRCFARENIEKIVSVQLLLIGVAPHLMGYSYLRTAILDVLHHLATCRTMPSSYGASVAAHFQTSTAGVERAIRHALTMAWEQASPTSRIRSMCQFRPTNREFVLFVAEKLRILFY